MTADERKDIYLDLLSKRRRVAELASECDRMEANLDKLRAEEQEFQKRVKKMMEDGNRNIEVIIMPRLENTSYVIVVERLEYSVNIREVKETL